MHAHATNSNYETFNQHFSQRKLTSIASLAKMYAEDPDRFIGGIDWPSTNKSLVKGLLYDSKVKLSSFVIDLDETFSEVTPTNQVLVFKGSFCINTSKYNENKFYLKLANSYNQSKFKNIIMDLDDLTGMPNAPKVRSELRNNLKSKKPRVVYSVYCRKYI
ncbi:hypothetical protein JOC36_000910 [Weissella uvarum]|uniref:hypothetical protein n=1 Tax=Weissella uvarum TaxID=1479233 RepID=UPI001960A86C|nr:hypothetical protein [Weissella uvarum]MBM7617353.1 hypothetical protein [Weissella uvarum]MCM0595758.1 hypothetical protein [Weissella uvarum]